MNRAQALDSLINEINKGDYPKLQEFIKTLNLPQTYRTCDLHGKCGGCIFMDYTKQYGGLYECNNGIKKNKYHKKITRARTDKCCRHYHERHDLELVYEYKVGANAKELIKK